MTETNLIAQTHEGSFGVSNASTMEILPEKLQIGKLLLS